MRVHTLSLAISIGRREMLRQLQEQQPESLASLSADELVQLQRNVGQTLVCDKYLFWHPSQPIDVSCLIFEPRTIPIRLISSSIIRKRLDASLDSWLNRQSSLVHLNSSAALILPPRTLVTDLEFDTKGYEYSGGDKFEFWDVVDDVPYTVISPKVLVFF